MDFKKAVELVLNKSHLTSEGIEQLKALAKNMNTGRSFDQKWSFCQENRSKAVITPEWIAGFSDGEGCFSFHIDETKRSPILRPSFRITQNTHDVFVLELIKKYFDCGILVPKRGDDTLETAKTVSSISNFIVYSESDIINIIIPLFDKHSLLTTKSLDYVDWKTLIAMKQAGEFKTEEGRKKMLS